MIAGVIQARMGSERCKNKMLRDFAGSNLITLALEKYSRPTEAFKLYFAAYEDELLSIGGNFNCELIKRKKDSVESEKIEVIMNYLAEIEEESVIFINPCHVFLKLETIERAVAEFKKKQAISMTAVVKSHTWYYFMDGRAINFLDPTNINTKMTEPVYEVTHAFHIFNRRRFLEHHYFWTHQKNDPVFFETAEIEAIDIDTELDFIKAESLYLRERF